MSLFREDEELWHGPGASPRYVVFLDLIPFQQYIANGDMATYPKFAWSSLKANDALLPLICFKGTGIAKMHHHF